MQRSALAFHINNIHTGVKETKLIVEEQYEHRHDQTIVFFPRFKGVLDGIANNYLKYEEQKLA